MYNRFPLFKRTTKGKCIFKIFSTQLLRGPSTKDVRQMGRGGGGFEISDIPGRGRGGGGGGL